jgi:LmbE family N-acetylglucosaminyl deacetylase
MSDTKRVVFYVGAHQDDWQLFMSPQAYTDLVAEDTTVIFIYTTAGDAGVDAGWRRGRSAGALSSIQFAKRQPIAAVSPQRVVVNKHPIACYTIANTHSYYLDLPDGNMDGGGFPATGSQSLQQLYEGRIPAISALVDQPSLATDYASWQDVVTTLRALLDRERGDDQNREHLVHILAPHESRHSDHKFTGVAVRDAITDATGYRLRMYEEYVLPDKAPNVSAGDLVIKAGLYLFYAQTAFEYSGRVEHFDDWHLSFLPRQYPLE